MIINGIYRIKERDIESWYNKWLKTANRVYKYAEDLMSKGHQVSSTRDIR